MPILILLQILIKMQVWLILIGKNLIEWKNLIGFCKTVIISICIKISSWLTIKQPHMTNSLQLGMLLICLFMSNSVLEWWVHNGKLFYAAVLIKFKDRHFFPNSISSGIFIFPVLLWFPEHDLCLFLSFDDYGHEET